MESVGLFNGFGRMKKMCGTTTCTHRHTLHCVCDSFRTIAAVHEWLHDEVLQSCSVYAGCVQSATHHTNMLLCLGCRLPGLLQSANEEWYMATMIFCWLCLVSDSPWGEGTLTELQTDTDYLKTSYDSYHLDKICQTFDMHTVNKCFTYTDTSQ